MAVEKTSEKAALKRFGLYAILSEPGRGAMDVVYKASDPQIDRLVAVKTVSIWGHTNKVVSAKHYPERQSVQFNQQDYRVQFLDLPVNSPEPLVSVLEVECDGEPGQSMENIRKNRKREGVGI